MFPTTHWTRIGQATLEGDAAGRAVLNDLCAEWRGPVLRFLHLRGLDPATAADVCQDFYHRLLRSRAWKRADRARGRFRNYLYGILTHTLRDHQRRSMRLLQHEIPGGEVPEAAPADYFPGDAEPLRQFDRVWAVGMLERALAVVRTQWEDSGKAAIFPQLRAHLVPGAAGEVAGMEEVAAATGLPVGTVKTEIHRLRAAFSTALQREIARTVARPEDVADEFAWLRQVLSDPGFSA